MLYIFGRRREEERERERETNLSLTIISEIDDIMTQKNKKSASIGIVFWDAKQVIEVDLKRKNYRLA